MQPSGLAWLHCNPSTASEAPAVATSRRRHAAGPNRPTARAPRCLGGHLSYPSRSRPALENSESPSSHPGPPIDGSDPRRSANTRNVSPAPVLGLNRSSARSEPARAGRQVPGWAGLAWSGPGCCLVFIPFPLPLPAAGPRVPAAQPSTGVTGPCVATTVFGNTESGICIRCIHCSMGWEPHQSC
jgi:hypothetical protein